MSEVMNTSIRLVFDAKNKRAHQVGRHSKATTASPGAPSKELALHVKLEGARRLPGERGGINGGTDALRPRRWRANENGRRLVYRAGRSRRDVDGDGRDDSSIRRVKGFRTGPWKP